MYRSARETAAAIRAELKTAFPKTKFSVRKDSESCVRIGWTDGPAEREVDQLVGKYQMGHFDGMFDIYEYSNRRDDLPQVEYVFTHRAMSLVSKTILEDKGYTNTHDPYTSIYRVFHVTHADDLDTVPNRH